MGMASSGVIQFIYHVPNYSSIICIALVVWCHAFPHTAKSPCQLQTPSVIWYSSDIVWDMCRSNIQKIIYQNFYGLGVG